MSDVQFTIHDLPSVELIYNDDDSELIKVLVKTYNELYKDYKAFSNNYNTHPDELAVKELAENSWDVLQNVVKLLYCIDSSIITDRVKFECRKLQEGIAAGAETARKIQENIERSTAKLNRLQEGKFYPKENEDE